jgi:hypothetical protein
MNIYHGPWGVQKHIKRHLGNMHNQIWRVHFHFCYMKCLRCWQHWISSTHESTVNPVRLQICRDENVKLSNCRTPFAHLLHCSWITPSSLLVEHSNTSAATASCSWLFSWICISRAATVTQKPGGITADNCNSKKKKLLEHL